ncbi:hypothetical protein PIROE2DRAFT_63399 [Piromyces sp. E2]|nr:hypothetical protein PIROE2DRAFT_63399 [Piromyces sp. E2]|eukprot:OUM60022.1 hypothetical protein PIROE2DRAFT_63399 [Piromyces sp. E2]
MDDFNSKDGRFVIENSKFSNISSENGSILNIKSLNDYNLYNSVLISNSTFENTSASKYGGVIYSLSEFTGKCITIENCEFKNNSALLGNAIYSLNKNSEPKISNIKELREIKGLVSTNPTKISIINDINNDNIISIYSGEKIPDNIKCKIFDDYDNGNINY